MERNNLKGNLWGWSNGSDNKIVIIAMEDLENNTTVFSTLRSLNNFISQRMEGVSGLATPGSSQSSLQLQYQQRMQLEEQAGQIHSKSQLLQVEREKMQMELSHKRARIELEKAANTNARNYEREADRNQELLTRIKQYQEREIEAENKLKEQMEMNKSYKKSMETMSKKMQEKENKLAEANETITVLKGKISELQWNIMNQEMQMTSQDSQKQELMEQLDIEKKKWQEASQQIQTLQASQSLLAEYEQKIKDLEQKLSQQEHDALIVKNMKAELARFPKMERELRQLREENAYFREMKENNGLLKEEVEGLQRKLERYEKVQAQLVTLELENEKLLGKLQSWEKLDQSTGLNIRTPDDLSRQIVALQQRELALKEQNSTFMNSLADGGGLNNNEFQKFKQSDLHLQEISILRPCPEVMSGFRALQANRPLGLSHCQEGFGDQAALKELCPHTLAAPQAIVFAPPLVLLFHAFQRLMAFESTMIDEDSQNTLRHFTKVNVNSVEFFNLL
ncbi:hypothetical protein TURU_109425 [Turdus rufiventris]|nr:hypothetical protein TURU_109425 [Turdus rufiventris]